MLELLQHPSYFVHLALVQNFGRLRVSSERILPVLLQYYQEIKSKKTLKKTQKDKLQEAYLETFAALNSAMPALVSLLKTHTHTKKTFCKKHIICTNKN